MMIPPDLSTDKTRRAAFAASTRHGFGPHAKGCPIGVYQVRHAEAWDAIEKAIRAKLGVYLFPYRVKTERLDGLTGSIYAAWVKVHVPGRGWYVIGSLRDFAR